VRGTRAHLVRKQQHHRVTELTQLAPAELRAAAGLRHNDRPGQLAQKARNCSRQRLWHIDAHRVEGGVHWIIARGSRTNEPVTSYVDGSLGYLVQLERVRFRVPGRSEESRLDLRVTMIFRREPVGWRIVHRHADSQMTRQGPRSGEGPSNNEARRTRPAQAMELRR
jgi:hypothetical protein